MPQTTTRSLPIIPARYQPPLPLDRFILEQTPDAEAVPMDVVFVGGGPAGLAGAIELSRLVKKDAESGGTLGEVEIAVLEKAAGLGEHSLSGAVVNPVAFRELFPDLKDADFPFRSRVNNERVYFLTGSRAIRMPTPPTMRNHGLYVASLCEIVRWLGERAEAAGVNIFTGFPAASLLVEGDQVIGVRTTPSGLDRAGEPGTESMPATDLTAKVTVLAEGTRGSLSQAFYQWQQVQRENPQIFALGVKEVWETKHPLDAVVHTLGWPLPTDAFGGSFMYPMTPTLVAIGLVVGLDYRDAGLDVHVLLQRMKEHPLFRQYLEGGEMVEWGAKTIPEGGYYAVPERRSGNGVLVVGDAAGYVEVASLKGIHYAMQSGIFAARAIFAALKARDCSAASLAASDRMVGESFIMGDLRSRRNMRLAFQDGLYVGGAKAGLMTLTGGAFPSGKIACERDADVAKRVAGEGAEPFKPDGALTFGKLDAVFKSGNATRDDIPSHLIVGADVPPEVAEMYQHMCPAGVYERDGDRLVVSPANCIDCKATDDLGPRWTPREGGSGARYRRM
ncbi:MAG TPA: electron-transfer flavoprotein:ubiquinone oxidoreductase [Gemmatimonadaceae bacterium]|nr:electron-transfer flavoprotein:ubiquinone oxidoreductase [Gemmatimonadaceae bacterium]